MFARSYYNTIDDKNEHQRFDYLSLSTRHNICFIGVRDTD